MKVEVKEAEVQQEEIKYPYIGKFTFSGGEFTLVLFHSPKNGIVIGGNYHNYGHVNNRWREDQFTPFKGTITLSNE